MKNFKKIIVLCIIPTCITLWVVYKLKLKSSYEEIEYENLYNIQTFEETEEEKNYIILHMAGEVVNPGIVKIEEGSRVADAIEAAGGLTENANTSKINLAYVLSDGQKIYIPSIHDENEKEYLVQNIDENFIDNEFSLKQNTKVNINTATQTELEALSGIGPSTALKIINYRKENGNFKTIEEIKNVPGIGDSKFQSIKDEICV